MKVEFTPITELLPVPKVRFDAAGENELNRRIYRVLLKWLPFADEQFREWDGRPNCGHFFGGHFWYCSDTSMTTFVYAVLATLGEYDELATGIPCAELKRKIIAGLRYAGFTHDTGPADCVRVKGVLSYTSEKKWGGRGDNFFMASQNGKTIGTFAITTLMMWDDLDDETKLLMQNVIASYADRWCDEEPRNGSYYDTQCEENGWTSMGIAGALALLPDHPHHEAWKKGFMAWSISSVTTFRDRLADPSGLIDTPATNRVKTVTFHPDMTTENHAFVHPSYLCAGTNLRAVHAILSMMCGQEVLDSALHNNVRLFERTIRVWAQFDGLATPVQGQDWWYNRQHERQLTHAVLNVMHDHPDAALLEHAAIDSIERIQASNSRGCLLEERGEECVINAAHAQYGKDLEPGSAFDLAKTYLLHAFGGPGAEPSDSQEFRERMSGVHLYPYGCLAVHRTPDTFTSFSWRNNVMALSIPRKGLWSVTPLYASYTGTMTFEVAKGVKGLTNEAIIRDVERDRITTYADGFGAAVAIPRGDRELVQNVGFVALPDGSSVYYERFRVLKPCKVNEMHTGQIGIRNDGYSAMPELAPGERTLHLPDRAESFRGFYGKEPNEVRCYGSLPYLNVDGEIGYLLYGSRKVTYINKHQYPKWKGVEDILILNDMGDQSFDAPETLDPFLVVNLPNLPADKTAEAYGRTTLYEVQDAPDTSIIEKDGYLAFFQFEESRQTVRAVKSLDGRKQLHVYEGSTQIRGDRCEWSHELESFSAGYVKARYEVELEAADGQVQLELSLNGERLILANAGPEEIVVRITVPGEKGDAAAVRLAIPSGAFRIHERKG